ncbi:MAG: protein TolR [Lysobacterales bacterium]|nr:protein TolR [Xanthomonadales bacterium]MCB1610758.1 protein TolR [Xanthomonadales bacterium]MCP5476204.1 protein TolR [Rhodanobacteraceae bacterium]
MRRKRRKPVSDINVVPYIDVMLVLLIIFMVTAPLMNLGVELDLPQANANPLDTPEDPVIVSVDSAGDLFLTIKGEREPIDIEGLTTKIGAFVRNNPKVPVLVGGDRNVSYGRVYEAMVALQAAGAPRVGLMADPLPQEPRK